MHDILGFIGVHLYRWQDLVGAFLGPFVAVILSALSYLVGRRVESRRQERETMRRVEVSVTYSLNSIASMRKKLQQIAGSVRRLIDEIQVIENPREYAMQTVNFPAIGTIYLDEELPRFVTKSYYLHNKLLWIHSGIVDVNNILSNLRGDFARVIRLNEKLLDLMENNPNPPAQRAGYAENLTLFANEIERFSEHDLLKGVTPLMQVKIYNDKLRKPWGRGMRARWKNEGVRSWAIRFLFGFKKPARNLDNIDRIDADLEAEVRAAIAEMEERDRGNQ
jgi:hypothetical protein